MVKLAASPAPRRARSLRSKLLLVLLIAAIIGISLYPQRFLKLWLTPDQQGQLLFQWEYYPQAAATFENPLWKGISLYAAEEFETAAVLFSQYQDRNGLFLQANAWAHSRNYLKAVEIYQQLLSDNPNDREAEKNRLIVQQIIDDNRLLSESQAAESGELSLKDETGPRSSEGDERIQFEDVVKEQLSAEELLQNRALTDMWMRQVQKDPTQFLKVKFYMQMNSSTDSSLSTEETSE